MPRPFRVLVVYKKDAYQQYIQEQQDPHMVRLLRRRHPDAVEIQQAHRVHEAGMESVLYALRQQPDVEFELAYRAKLKLTKRYDLVVAVGGDGTFLQASFAISTTPILGVNSDPRRSEAVFCAATRRTFPRLLRQALIGTLPVTPLHRLEVTLNGQQLQPPALNDVLIVHDDPATMSRYRLKLGRQEEFQKSSGVWVATAAGSTSAVLAAGGVRLPWASKQFQYKPRELYRGRLSHPRLKGGVLRPGARVQVTWLMRRGALMIDGAHVRFPLRFADRIDISLSSHRAVQVLGLPARRLFR